jgi:hypothetical protein
VKVAAVTEEAWSTTAVNPARGATLRRSEQTRSLRGKVGLHFEALDWRKDELDARARGGGGDFWRRRRLI